VRGGEVAFAFTLGTIPLLWIAQASLGRLRMKLTPARMITLQRSLAAVAALMMIWRLRDTIGFGEVPEGTCPMCHTTASAPAAP
jgi:hypothetical protein